MKRQRAIGPTSDSTGKWCALLQGLSPGVLDWASTDGLVWLHLLKTVTAGLLALGIAMLLDLPQPRIAMTTVFVLMQPFSGMVLAKSFYRVVGTAVGAMAALALGALFVQQAELHMVGMIAWISACIAAAVRYRHFRWYGFVLAGYTAALIGIPNVTTPDGLFLAALTRAAEVTVGIVCSSAVSALIVPQRSSLALLRTLQLRYRNFAAFAADVLSHQVDRRTFERRFAALVDEIVGFEATRIFAAFEDPAMRLRSHRLGRLNNEFMDACARLHALHQLLKRSHASDASATMATIAPHLRELAALLTLRRDASVDVSHVSARLREFQAVLPRRVRQIRKQLHEPSAELLADFDTAAELLYRFVDECAKYSDTYDTLAHRKPGPQERGANHYVSITNGYAVAFTFIRSATVMSIAACFWIATGWPSGGLAVIGAALACALTSTSPDPTNMAVQMALGAGLATLVGYAFTCYVYPNIDGFPLLCVMLAPVLALGAHLATRKRTAGLGVGFSVFFCLLAGPDNVVVFEPDVVINNGIALAASMLLAAIVLATVFPADMPWLVERIMDDLRAQVVLACKDQRPELNQRFQSSTHDLASQLRLLLSRRSRRRRHALRWMLVTLEVGHAVIDLRNETGRARYLQALDPRWPAAVESVLDHLAQLFERPDARTLDRAFVSVRSAIWIAQDLLEAVHTDSGKRHDAQRILSCLHFIRTALLDKDAPFKPR
ncbi:p-hydroxybenzoic acid efflux pump subunit AaeB [Paraburkholderia kirstenboschensis]|uniref:FUSC family protein n=1 Tax=Paraburkholderia kirstenboschensis TaxID=1245436 RepID=UPI000A6FFCE6|nr:FUSC family protein [Paraburkholderia kirstenboschensis]CAD6550593.1 p-hydroxybenzoic acid efflux pump subunit AaeB [Paraburkholderia kirstenboschensis]